MTRGRRIAIIALFLTTALIGAGAIYIGNRLSNQPEVIPDDAAAEGGWCDPDEDGYDYLSPCDCTTNCFDNYTQCGGDGKKTQCRNANSQASITGTWHATGQCCSVNPTSGGGVACEVVSQPGAELLQIRVSNSAQSARSYNLNECYCPDGRGTTCDECKISQQGLEAGASITHSYTGPDACGSWQLDVTPLGGGAACYAYYNSEKICTEVSSTPTPTPTPTVTVVSQPFDIQVLATCQDGNGPIYSVGGAIIIIGQGTGNPELNTVLNDNGAYTTSKYTTGPFAGHVRIGGAGTISLKERTNYPNGAVVRTVDISQLHKITPVSGNSTGVAPQCNSSGNNAPGQCNCSGQYEVCNFNSAGANSSGRFFFEFKFSNCMGTAEVTPTPVPGELSCGNICVPGSSICAAGTVCSNVEGTYRCALQACINNPGSCADICSYEKLPQTALISDEADRIILAVILVLMGGFAIRFGMNEKLGQLFWAAGGKYVLSKIHPQYAHELRAERERKAQMAKKKAISKQKQERKKFEKNF